MQHAKDAEDVREISTSVRYTGQVKTIEAKYADFHPFLDVLSDIASQNPTVPVIKIETFLSQLMENEFLLSELRPPLTNTDMLDHLIGVLSRIEITNETYDYTAKLQEIQKAIEKYNATSIGEGMELYNEIIQLQNEMFKCKNYLQIDMKTHTNNNMLDNDLRNELNRFATAMGRLAAPNAISEEMASYRDLFVEKYGYDAEIPILELLDTDKGLGAPKHHGINTINRPVPKRPKPEKEERLRALMERKFILALREGKNIIDITDEDVDKICENDVHNNENRPMDFKQSFELYLLLHSNTSDTSDKTNDGDRYFTIAPMPMSDGLGKSFGRFSDMLADDELALLNEGFQKQKELLSDYVIAEVTELPSSGRTSNVSINNSDYDYQISLTTNPCADKHTLSIRDLYIGISRDDNQFYVKSKSLGKKVIVTMTCMLNPTFGSNAFRFLREVSSVRKFDVGRSIMNVLESKFEYSPRITYGKVIIRPETWQISRRVLGIDGQKKGDTKGIFEQSFISHRQTWKIPRYVFMNEGDNRLMLDLDNPAHRSEIYSTINKHSRHHVTLTELGCDFSNYTSVNEKGKSYVTEIVVPFIMATDSENDNTKATEITKSEQPVKVEVLKTFSDISANRMNINREKLMLLPGNDKWFYYKLYGCSKRQDELIAVAHDALEYIVEEGIAQKYFFIRYSDPEPHLRIRVQPAEKRTSDLFVSISRWIDDLYAEGLVSKVTSDSYVRETERYGGFGLIERVENYFCYDSKLVMKLLMMNRFGSSHINMDVVGVSFIISALEAFGLSIDEQEIILNSQSDDKSHRKEFQNQRKMFMRAVDSGDDWFEIRASTQNPEIYDLINDNSAKLKELADAIYESDRQGELTNSIRGIVTSVIHMFCNRLMGNNAWERKIYALARHGVYSLKGYLRHRQKANINLQLPDNLLKEIS